MLNRADFKPVSINDRNIFAQHYKKFPQVHSDNTFTNMVCWNHYAHYQYAYVRKNLIIASTIDEVTRFRPPISPRDPILLRSLMQLASDISDNEPVVLIDPDTASWMRETCPGINLVPDRNHFEYIYRSEDLAELPGKNYLTVRRQINKFRRNCTFSVEPINKENWEEVKRFLIEWCEWKGCGRGGELHGLGCGLSRGWLRLFQHGLSELRRYLRPRRELHGGQRRVSQRWLRLVQHGLPERWPRCVTSPRAAPALAPAVRPTAS